MLTQIQTFLIKNNNNNKLSVEKEVYSAKKVAPFYASIGGFFGGVCLMPDGRFPDLTPQWLGCPSTVSWLHQ
jgi:hypothetical protein